MTGAPDNFELVIIGAGPAGAAAAVTARRAGLAVALIDKAKFPRHKLCGGLVSGRGLKALDAIFKTRPPREMFQISRAVSFRWAGEELLRFEAPYDLWFTMRREFDQVLCQAALAAGAADFTGRRWAELDAGAGRIVLDDGQVLGFRALIAADGVTSPVAIQLFGRAFDPGRIGFALEAECPRAADSPPVMEIDFKVVNWGYGWRFPKRAGLTVGIGGLQSENPAMRSDFDRFAHGFDGARTGGAFLPFGDFRREPGRANLLFAGDAAGLVDPLTGEGIAYALESGALAAKTVAGALAAGRPERAAKAYKQALKGIHSELSRATRLRQIAFSTRFSALFREKLQMSQRLRQVFFDLLEGNMSYRDIEKLVAAGIIRKLSPGFGPRRPGRGAK